MQITEITPKLQAVLEQFAVQYRWYGSTGCDRNGAWSRLREAWQEDRNEQLLMDEALSLCRSLVAAGHKAFSV